MKKFLLVVIVGVFLGACSDRSPTAPMATTPFPDAATPANDIAGSLEGPITNDQATSILDSLARRVRQLHLAAAEDAAADEEFNCTGVEEVRVRFSDPGFIDGLDVGLFVKFVGMPAGEKTLRVWWDYENAFHRYEDVDIGEGDVNPLDASVFDFQSILEHRYDDVRGTAERRVRVEMILAGQTGNCARNRDIVVSQQSFDHLVSFGGVPVCNIFFGANMVLLANISPPIPPGTTYTIRARIDAPPPVVFSQTIAQFFDASVTDVATPPLQTTAPPNSFTASLTTTVAHAQLGISGGYFSLGATSPITVRVLSINIPGKTVGFAGTVSGTCP